MIMGANNFTLEELEALFKEEELPETPPVEDEEGTPPVTTPPVEDAKSTKKAETKAVADRINAVRLEEQNAIAKQMGYNSYDEMIKSKEEKLIKDKGYDPKELAPIVDELLKTRIDNDPRIKELDSIRKQQIADYAERELAIITKLTDGEITKMSQLSKEVIAEWSKTGSLKSAFLLTEGEKYIAKAKSASTKGGTNHLQQLGGTNPPAIKTRGLTDEEKSVYKFFNPGVTQEQLDKKQVPITKK